MAKNIYQIAAIERRRAKSYVASLQRVKKQIKGATGKRAISKKIREVERAVARSYKGSGYSIEKATSEIRGLVGETGRRGKARANAVFQQQIGLASRGEKSSLGTGEMGRFKSKAFYRATQRLWEGVPAEQRNTLIMQKLGVSTLGEAYDIVMKDETVRSAVSLYEESLQKNRDTAKNKGFTEGKVVEYEKSPVELGEIEMITM